MRRSRNRRFPPLLMAGLFAGSLAFAGGCATHAHAHAAPPHHHHHARARVVVVEKGHVHTRSCGHYRHRRSWYHLEGHVHGPRCGHVHVRGVWVLKK